MAWTTRIGAIASTMTLAACATAGGTAAGKPQAFSGKPAFVKAQFEGAAPDALDRLLGAPSLTRREGEGEFRRYAFRDCALIVILYPDESGAVAVRELDAAAKVSGEAKPDLDMCLALGVEESVGSG
jgi:hypothetical protein